jgi:hypothetical protein
MSVYRLQDEEYVLLSTRIISIKNWDKIGNIPCGICDPAGVIWVLWMIGLSPSAQVYVGVSCIAVSLQLQMFEVYEAIQVTSQKFFSRNDMLVVAALMIATTLMQMDSSMSIGKGRTNLINR